MSAIQLDVSADLREQVVRDATRLGVSEAEWVAEAIRARLSAVSQLEYLQSRGRRGDRHAFDRVMDQVPDSPPVPGDDR